VEDLKVWIESYGVKVKVLKIWVNDDKVGVSGTFFKLSLRDIEQMKRKLGLERMALFRNGTFVAYFKRELTMV